ncbi:MAG: hypothetical protein JO235_12400, partial [Chroococcidiopsidaceae cyanobacterium CP_BM_RX_35]|nr:hypothetical protein [Chroococcidiopsidaceae cyanobacterium CP_BM_RX_35]
MSTQSYSSYLRLPIILSSQHPLLPFEDVVGWTSERYFIVCHQVSELLMSQVLMDFEQATSLVDCSRDWANAKLLLTRAASLTVLLCRNLEQIAYLCPQSAFFAFRPALEGSSGKESLQFQKALSILSGKSSYRQTL